MALSTVAVLVEDDTSLFEVGVTAEVFGVDRTDDGLPPTEFRLCAESGPGPVPTQHHPALTVTATHGLDGLVGADVVIPVTLPRPGSPAAVEALREAHASGAVVLALCTGAFLAAQAGLLSGRRATTHWMFADELAAAYPDVDVTADEIYIDLGDVITTAGTAATVDACLYLVRRELGQRAAGIVARRMVAPPQRHGGQLQYVLQPVAPATSPGLAPTLEWALAHLHEPLDVASLARHAASPGLRARVRRRTSASRASGCTRPWRTAYRHSVDRAPATASRTMP